MRPLRYSINVTLDGCCDHRAIFTGEDLHRHAAENLDQADALLFGRVTYEMMEAAFRPKSEEGLRDCWKLGKISDFSFYLVYLNNTSSGKRIVKTIDLCDQKTAP
jgi:hypothetical protein